MPDATGLAENPLFIRYSLQGFGKKLRLIPRWTREFAFPWPGIGLRIGVMPFVCVVVAVAGISILDLVDKTFESWYWSEYARLNSRTASVDELAAGMKTWPYESRAVILDPAFALLLMVGLLGLYMLALRLIGVTAERHMAAFARNVGRKEWGEELALTRLQAGEIGEALIGATLMEEIRALRVLWTAFAAVIGLLLAATMGPWAVHILKQGEGVQMAVELIAYLGFASAAALEACGLAIFMAAAHARASARTEGRLRDGIKQTFWIAGALLACHAPSLLGLAAHDWIDTKFPIARG